MGAYVDTDTDCHYNEYSAWKSKTNFAAAVDGFEQVFRIADTKKPTEVG